MQGSKDAATIAAEARKLIEQVRRQLEQADDEIRAMGFDPDKVRASMASLLGPKEKAEADRLFTEDMEAVEREVAEEMARLNLAASGAKGVKKARSMI